MKLRPAAIAIALAAVAALLLSGCENKTGAAAIVGDTTISMSDVDGYVYQLSEDELAKSQFGTAENQLAFARSLVLSYSVAAEVTTQAMDKLGLDPTPAELQAAHDDGLQYIYQNPDKLTGDAADAQLASYLQSFGVEQDFLPTLLLFGEQMSLISDELHVTGLSAVGTAIGELGIEVNVNPRFGTWSFEQMSTIQGPSVPSFISGGSGGASASASS